MHLSGLDDEKPAASADQQSQLPGKAKVVAGMILYLVLLTGLQISEYSAYEDRKNEAAKVLEFSKKSEAHTFGAKLMLRCSNLGWDVMMKKSHCLSQAVGQATIERGGAFGEEVKAAVLDIDTSMKSLKDSE